MFIQRILCQFIYSYIQNTDVVTPQGSTIKAVAVAQAKPNDEVRTKSYIRPNLHNQSHYPECTTMLHKFSQLQQNCAKYIKRTKHTKPVPVAARGLRPLAC